MASSYGEDASKDALRSGYQALQVRMSPSHRARVDRDVLLHARVLKAIRTASVLLAYYPCREEIDDLPLVREALAAGRKVALPRRVAGDASYEFRLVTSLKGLLPGALGAWEPDPGTCPLVGPDLMDASVCLVPGLVFDAWGFRIGYGAGYYDNFLKGYRGLRVGLVRALQVSGNPLPVDDHDEPVDVLVSDASVWQCRKRGEQA